MTQPMTPPPLVERMAEAIHHAAFGPHIKSEVNHTDRKYAQAAYAIVEPQLTEAMRVIEVMKEALIAYKTNFRDKPYRLPPHIMAQDAIAQADKYLEECGK